MFPPRLSLDARLEEDPLARMEEDLLPSVRSRFRDDFLGVALGGGGVQRSVISLPASSASLGRNPTMTR